MAGHGILDAEPARISIAAASDDDQRGLAVVVAGEQVEVFVGGQRPDRGTVDRGQVVEQTQASDGRTQRSRGRCAYCAPGRRNAPPAAAIGQ